jgi:hypothetical protein
MGGTAANGTAFTDFLDKLNGGVGPGSCLAFTCDWRLPTIEELQTILLAPYTCSTSPCIDPIFGPTVSDAYWSSTTVFALPGNAQRVDFYDGYIDSPSKTVNKFVRAVRTVS